jgi:ceramide glucosyltransferase
MWPPLEWILIGWTGLAACWWAVAIGLVHGKRRRNVAPGLAKPVSPAKLSVFKPIPAIEEANPPPQLVAALESFVSQLEVSDELLLGIERKDATKWEPVIERWRKKFPQANLKTVVKARPARFLNPRVSWCHTLAELADGELWLWSDADMIASADALATMRRELLESGVGMVTCPYVVRNVERAPMILEALFVNVEFYPGVLFCGRQGRVNFGLGSGMMFSAARFRERAHWELLGARMADDNALGKALGPVKISEATLTTLAAESNGRNALEHYRRWHKTIRWCNPAGYAGQILTVPILGWWMTALLHPAGAMAWCGLTGTAMMEIVAAALIFRSVACRVRAWWMVVLWSLLLRPLTWLAAWSPWPVVFRSQGRIWWSLYRCSECSTDSSPAQVLVTTATGSDIS